MKVLTYGRDTAPIDQLLESEKIELVKDDPQVIVTYGGDGSLLEAERNYPGLPKLPLRHSAVCKTCIDHDTSHAVKALARGTLTQTEVAKLEVTINGKTYLALNEFSLHHQKPQQAIRFSVQINDDPHEERAIGDGVIIATPFGSHAYYRSITKGIFRQGIGIAYNNTTESIDHMVVKADDAITVKVLRGPAYFTADNDQPITLEADQSFTVRQSNKRAILLGLDHFRCPDCGSTMIKAVE